MTGFQPAISPVWVMLWFLVFAALTLRRHRAFQQVLSRPYRWLLTGLALMAALVIAVMLLQPYREVSRPDHEGFRVAVLADVSHSMGVRDLADGSQRVSLVEGSLAAADPDSLFNRLKGTYRAEARVFTEHLRPVPAARPDSADGTSQTLLLPGRSAIGEALKDCLDTFSGVPLGAILLLSDGRHNDGTAPAEVAKVCRGLDIPVSCVGIGRRRTPGDLSVTIAETSQRAVKGEPFTLRAAVRNQFPMAVDTVAELRDAAGRVLSVQAVAVPADSVATVDFEVVPLRAGFTSWTVGLQPFGEDFRRDNDLDFAGIRVREPDRFSILYLGGHLSWEFRFIRILTERNDQLTLAAAIRTGHDAFYRAGLPEEVARESAGLPVSADALNRHDAVLLDTRALPVISPGGLAAIQGFVEHRGGGLLCFGPLDDIPKQLGDMLPVRQAEPVMVQRQGRIVLNPDFIFDRDPSGLLHVHGGLPLEAGGPLWLPAGIKLGARAAATIPGSERVALAAQRFGSGRVAYIGFETSWRWRLRDSVGEDTHSAFWNALLVWLGSTGKKRLDATCAAAKAGVGESVPLDVTVRGTDFRAAPDARITASVHAPGGEQTDIALDPAAEAPGRYTGLFFPEETGQYRVTYRVRLPNESFDHTAHFLARQTGVEAEDTTYAEDILRDVARVTRGAFWDYRDVDSIDSLRLSSRIPVKRERWYWARSWLMYVLLAILVSTHWFLRRRIGLR